MKKIGSVLFISTCALLLAGCAPPAANAPANANTNSNANAAKPAAAVPTTDALMAMEQQANQAFFKGESQWFETNLSDKFVMYVPGVGRFDKAAAVKYIAGTKCDVKDGWKLEEPQLTKIDNDTYALSYKGTFDGSCTSEGKTEKLPGVVRATSIVVRSGDKWLGAFHGENPIIDPKSPPPAPPKLEPKKSDSRPADTKSAANANSNAAGPPAPPAPVKSANSDALAATHAKGWEAFKNKDAKWFEANITDNMTFVDPAGGVHSGKANVVKLWTVDMKCEGITKTSFTDAIATSVSPTVEILTGKGNADGTCDGQKNGDLYTTAVYVKEGDAWKLAFMFESLPMPGM